MRLTLQYAELMRTIILCCVAVLSLIFPAKSLAQAPASPAPTEAKADLDRRMGWFRDARFGMFIHWGLYAIPAGQWEGKPIPSVGEWILNSGKIQPAEYMKLQAQFNPIDFNADEWVRIAKLAGQKYIVITSKHHDGFALWNSKVSNFDVMATPFKRDILLELARACERGGIQLCFYHSIMDWTHDDYVPHRSWDPRKNEDADFDRYVGYMKEQLKELVSVKYGKIGILWFDGEWEESWTHERGLDLAKYVHSLDPDIIINNRVDKGRSGMAGMNGEGDWAGDYGTPEQEVPSTGFPGRDWETCMTMNDTWGFKSDDHNWKSAKEMIRMLCDIASKGGNFLLNVGPQANGQIPQESIDRLMRIGQWMETNGDAIYGTHASPFVRLPWGRCTQKPLPNGQTRLYFHIFDWPKSVDGTTNALFVPGLTSEVLSARLLGATGFAAQTSRQGDGWAISIPVVAPDDVSSVIAVDIAGEPKVVAFAVLPDTAGTFHLTAKEAELRGHLVYEEKCDNIGFWADVDGTARWALRLQSGGKYNVTADIAAAPNEGGSRFRVLVSGAETESVATLSESVETTVQSGANWCDFKAVDMGIISCPTGDFEIVVKPLSKAGSAVMNLRSITLVPLAK